MKKRFVLLFFLPFIISSAYSQMITGKVIDETNQPVAFANIILLSLPDSIFIQGTITDEQGIFSFDNAENIVESN